MNVFEQGIEGNKIPIEIFIKRSFEKADLVLLGEAEHGTHDQVILNTLKEIGDSIQGIFIEIPINYQRDIDTYVETGEVTEHLEDYFRGAEEEGNNIRGILNIFDFLKKANKSIICIDSSKLRTSEYAQKSAHGYYFLRGKSRDEDMCTIIQEQYAKKPGKYLAIVGGKHIEPNKHFRTGEDTLAQEMAKNFSGSYTAIQL